MGEVHEVAFSHNHHWAVTDTTNHCVYIFNEQDQLVRKFGSHGEGPGQFNGPRGIAFDEDKFLYVADDYHHKIHKFDLTGQRILQFGEYGSSDKQLSGPFGVTVHHNKVYIADRSNHRISVYQTDGT